MATAGYSGTPLPKKLGIKDGHVVAALDAPGHLSDLLVPLPDDVVVKVSPEIDAVGLCAAVGALLDDIDRRRALHRRALEFAASNGYADEARRIVEALLDFAGSDVTATAG